MRAKGWFLTLLSLAVMFGAVLGVRFYQGRARADEADRLYASGAYEAAMALYRELKDTEGFERCKEALRDERYQEAERLLEAGEPMRAASIFKSLGDYRESEARLKDCDFQYAGQLTAQGRPEQAREIYVRLGDYPGCAQALEALIPALYTRARELAGEGKLDEACTLWWVCGDYQDSERYLKRADSALARMRDKSRKRLNDPARRLDNPFYAETYRCDEAYILFPEEPNADTRFFLYFPGGRDEELYTEFLYYYMANPAPNTLAVFLRRNDLPDMAGCCRKGLRLMDEAAADCGLFVDSVLVAGSSLGAYPALQCPRIAAKEFLIDVPCVLSLDAGNAWDEPALVPTAAQCRELAGLGTELYLFQPTWEDTDYEPVARLVDNGCWVMLAGCLHDEHEQISYDVLGSGVIDWALGDRSGRCPGDYYAFRRLRAS